MGSLDLEKGGYQCFNLMRIDTEPCKSCIHSEQNQYCHNYSPINVSSLIASGIIRPARLRLEEVTIEL